jgi:hypothetical protein
LFYILLIPLLPVEPARFVTAKRDRIDRSKKECSTVNLSNDAGASVAPAIAISGNNVYVAWTGTDNAIGITEILLRKSVNAETTFGSVVNLSHNNGFSDFPAITVTPNDF